MKISFALSVMLLLIGSYNSTESWISLLDKDLSAWENYLSYRHQDGYNGKIPLDANGKPVDPIGHNKDTYGVFSVLEDHGELVLRVSGEIYGCLYTREEYENYHLTLKIKWGEKKYVPRLNKLKDSGILYHSIGEAGVDYWRSWMLSQEFQIMEGHMGDYWPQASSGADIRAYPSEGVMNSVASQDQPFRPFGAGSSDNFCLRSENFESGAGEWTTLDLICFGGNSLHIVNGNVVMVLKDSRYLKDGRPVPLTKGKIQLQSEAAELFFKDIKIRKIDAMPAQYKTLFQ
jgi:hypothetical protein